LQPAGVWEDDIDSWHGGVGKHHTEIDQQHLAVDLNAGAITADLSETT
tara:strand:+ start:354 stop:497 length:144 start_codon:yes stop_codon:yes gene_type:complete